MIPGAPAFQSMNLRTNLILFSLLAVAALAGGLWWSQPLTLSAASTAPPTQAVETVKPAAPSLPPVGNGGTPSPADLETRIQGMTDANWRGDGGRELQQVLKSVAPADIPKLLAFTDKNPDARVRRDLRNDLLSRWAQASPQAAAAWANSLPNPDDREYAIPSAIGQWARTDLKGALTWAQQLPEGRAKSAACRTAALAWAETDPPAALAWALQLPEGAGREGALDGIGLAWARKDPKAAAKAASTLPTGAGRDDFIVCIAEQWGWRTDAQAALA